jgi:hypothetical protein
MMINAWEQQPDESPKAFEAFTLYRDMGTARSIPKVARKCTKNESLLRRWSTNHQWVSRAEAWDNEQDRLMREALIKGVTAMRKKHVDMADALFRKAAQALLQIPTADMTPRDIVTLVDVAAKLERISRGEATEHTDGNTKISGRVTIATDPYAELSVEELRKLARLANEPENQ